MRFVGFHLAACLLAVLVVSSVKSYEQIQTMVIVVMAGVTVAALYGCYQGVIGVEVEIGRASCRDRESHQ